MTDAHYNEEGDMGWNTSEKGTGSTSRGNVDNFIDDMNNNFKPDFVVALGDMTHAYDSAQNLVSESTVLEWIEDIRQILESEGGSGGNGLDMPIFYTLGNWEYAGASTWDMSNIYDAWGFTGLGDTWDSFDYGAWKIVLLNTDYNTQDFAASGFKIPDSGDPADELSWLIETVVQGTKRPIALFGHHPLCYGYGITNDYDYVINQRKVSRYLSHYPNVVHFHGHSHHSTRRTQRRIGPFGTPNVFIDQISEGYGEYGELVLQEGSWKVIPNSPSKIRSAVASDYGRTWAEDMRKVRGLDYELEYNFDSVDTYTTSVTGSGTVWTHDNTAAISTGSTEGSTAELLSKTARALGRGVNDYLSWEGRMGAFGFRPWNLGSEEFWMIQGDRGASSHIGFKCLNGGNLYATVGDGSTETTALIYDNPIGGASLKLGFVYFPFEHAGETRIEFYSNGKMEAIIDTNLPTGFTDSGRTTINLYADNTGVAANRNFTVQNWWLKVPYLEALA